MKKIFGGAKKPPWKDINEMDRKIIQKHWSRSAVFTDAWDLENLPDEQFLPEEELQKGEVWAASRQVGCYTVRRARRIYKAVNPGYDPEEEKPAEREDVEFLKAPHEGGGKAEHLVPLNFGLRENLRDTIEISARHVSNPGGAFIYITRAASARGFSWGEDIKSICTVKENDQIPDECASLLVRKVFLGDSFSSDTWYKLEPAGGITTLGAGLYGNMEDDAVFK
ncbi:MAG: hypothetical protein NC123_17275 [Butyrivibrio sp.]|nr:hypothetical protein [Butyrivibrio sp.]